MLGKLVKNHKLNSSLKLICQKSSSFSNRDNDRFVKEVEKEIEESKKELKWRPHIDENPSAWNSKFKLFADQEQTSDFISLMQQPIDISPKAIKNWWKKRNVNIERHMQSYMPERHDILGSDLAAAHFIVFRGGAVKFINNPQWIRKNKEGEYQLPDRYNPIFKVEAIKCDNMVLYYEGLENLRRLQNMKFISFVNVKEFDDWSLDRFSGSENPKLEVLDLSGTNVTYRGLSCIYRFDNLKLLILDDPKSSKEMELSCALLEVDKPNLKIFESKNIHNV